MGGHHGAFFSFFSLLFFSPHSLFETIIARGQPRIERREGGKILRVLPPPREAETRRRRRRRRRRRKTPGGAMTVPFLLFFVSHARCDLGFSEERLSADRVRLLH